jgi:hypothetical protein
MGLGNMFGRMALGAAGGYALTGNMGGAIGGAAGGFAFPAMSKFGGGLGFAGGAGKGLGMLSRGIGRGRGYMEGRIGGPLATYGARGLGFAQRGIGTARGFLGGNALAVNKWAGRGMATLGAASGAYIGSSVIGSNRGY